MQAPFTLTYKGKMMSSEMSPEKKKKKQKLITVLQLIILITVVCFLFVIFLANKIDYYILVNGIFSFITMIIAFCFAKKIKIANELKPIKSIAFETFKKTNVIFNILIISILFFAYSLNGINDKSKKMIEDKENELRNSYIICSLNQISNKISKNTSLLNEIKTELSDIKTNINTMKEDIKNLPAVINLFKEKPKPTPKSGKIEKTKSEKTATEKKEKLVLKDPYFTSITFKYLNTVLFDRIELKKSESKDSKCEKHKENEEHNAKSDLLSSLVDIVSYILTALLTFLSAYLFFLKEQVEDYLETFDDKEANQGVQNNQVSQNNQDSQDNQLKKDS